MRYADSRSGADQSQPPVLVRRGQILEIVTLACCFVETAVGLTFGMTLDSVALLSFGAQSLIEVASASVLLWQLTNSATHSQGSNLHGTERRVLRIEGYCFAALAFFVSLDAGRSLVKREAPTASMVGIALALFSLVAMPLLAAGKRKLGRNLASEAMKADATQSALCGYFAVVLLVGLLLSQYLSIWWADPVASLVMVPIIIGQSKQALEGKTCSHCS